MPTKQLTAGQILKQERKRRKWTVPFLADLTGLSRPTLNAIERDDASIGYKVDRALCRALGLDKNTFLNLRD